MDTRELLIKCGITPALSGFDFLATAIDICYENKSILQNGVCKVLYPSVAALHITTTSRVERAMRHAVEKVFDNQACRIDLISNFYGNYDKPKPTNSEFIGLCIEVKRLEEKHE